MGAPLRRSARLLKSESSVPVARDLDVEMVNSGGGPVEQQRPDTRPSVSHSSVSQDPTTAPSPKPELGESTDDDDEEPANHHVRTNRPDRRQVPRSTTPASQPTKPVERDATSPQRPSVPRLLSEPSRKRKTSDRPMDTGSDTDYEDYQGLSPPGQDESESDSGTESRQQTRKSTRPRRGKKIHDTLQDGSDGLIHPRPVLKRPRRKRRKNISMTTDYANETLHTTPLDHGHEHEHEHGHTSDHCHDHGHPSEHTHEYGTHHGGVLPASGPHRHHHHQHGHDDSPRIHNHHEQRPYWKEHQLMDSVSISELRTRLLGNGWENSKTDPSVMIARQPAMCIKFGLKPEEKTEDASQTDRDTVQYELDYDGTLVLSSPDQKAVNDVLGILWVYLRHNNDDDSGYDDADEDADYEDADYEDADYDDDDYDDADYELPVHPFTSRQDTSQHPPDLSSRKRKVKDFVSLDSDDESAQHAVRVKLPYRNRDLPPNRQETPQHDTEMEDPVTDSHQDDNESGRTHVNALDGLQSTKQNPNKAVDVSIDGFVETTFLLRVGSSRTELEATLQDFKWRKHHFDESHYVYKHRADIHLFDDRFYLSGNKTEYFNLWHRNLQKFIHEEQDSVDKSTIAAAVPQWRKRGEQSTLTPYVKMTFARLLEECRERNPEIPTKPKDSRSTRRHATGPELIDRLMADDDAHHQQEESKNAVALVQSMHKNEALDDLQFECNRCGETKPRSDFTRANRPSKELEQRKACNECAEKEAAQRLAKKEHALKERTQFMRNKYPDELGIGELSTRDLTQCMLCRHFYLKGFDREEHRKTCPLLNKMCKFCSRGFPNEVWQADHCSEARCEEVRARQKHQREEAKGYCPYCYLTFPLSHAQYSFHVTACHKEHTLCTPCGKYFKAGQIDNHEFLLAALPELRRLTCAAAVTKYMSILRDCPERVLEADIEGNVGASIKTPFHTFQVTISNGKGEVVVPQTVIDHGEITKEQLLHLSKANSHVRVRGSFEKYYEEPSQERATGRVGVRSSTWSEIAVQLEVYRVKRGLPKQDPFLAFVDWSVNHVDFDAIKAGLASVKPEHLAADMIKAQLGPLEKRTPVNTTAMIEAGLRLTEEGLPSFKPEQLLPADPVRGPEGAPVDFNPLLWWRVFKRTMGLTKGSRDGYLLLGLSNFFSILYPDERRLAACAHDSGPDVEMLFKILRFTRIWWQECRIDGRLGRHLTKNGVVGPNIDDDALRKIEEEEYEAIVKEGETEREEADADNSRENVDGKYVDRDDTGALVDE
ncbi:hypothetical protein J4E80_010018 [Alternaria sp. BMP 0032]|nr:hypothetical protein J4E80_010018 [Alternaria sp. BMP 0032]